MSRLSTLPALHYYKIQSLLHVIREQTPKFEGTTHLHLSVRSKHFVECFHCLCLANVAKCNAKPPREGSLFHFKLILLIGSLTDRSHSFFLTHNDGDVCGHIAWPGPLWYKPEAGGDPAWAVPSAAGHSPSELGTDNRVHQQAQTKQINEPGPGSKQGKLVDQVQGSSRSSRRWDHRQSLKQSCCMGPRSTCCPYHGAEDKARAQVQGPARGQGLESSCLLRFARARCLENLQRLNLTDRDLNELQVPRELVQCVLRSQCPADFGTSAHACPFSFLNDFASAHCHLCLIHANLNVSLSNPYALSC